MTDPCARSSGYSVEKLTADIVTISNSHPNHAANDEVGGSPVVLDGPGEYEVRGVVITGFRTDTGRRRTETTRNTAFIIEIDDVTVCHLGDLANLLTSEQVELAKDADVLLVPVGGHCTLAPAQAVEVVNLLEPKIVIPMHYATEVSTAELEPLDRFLREMGLTQVESQTRVVVSPNSLPAEPAVTVLQYRR